MEFLTSETGATETEKHWETRRQFRDDLLDSIRDRLGEVGETVESGPLEGVHIVTRAQWMDVIYEIGDISLPPVDDHVAEVVTGATVLVWAKCPRCHIAAPISLTIEPELRVDDASAELRLRAKAKPRTHVCGQLTIPVGPPVEGQESFELEDIVGDADADPGGCPWPGCELANEHPGAHQTAVDDTPDQEA